MSKQGPPSYEESQGMPNPHYMGPNPTYPNAGQVGYPVTNPPENPGFKDPGAGHPYPGAGQPYPTTTQPYPGAGQPYPGAGQPYPGAGQPYPHPAQPYPAPGAGQPYPGQPHVAGHTVPLQTPVPVILTTSSYGLGPRPSNVYCPQCKENVLSKTRVEAGTITWIACATLALIGCWAGCCLIPFCIDGCQDVYHSCPNCNTFFGRYSRLD